MIEISKTLLLTHPMSLLLKENLIVKMNWLIQTARMGQLIEFTMVSHLSCLSQMNLMNQTSCFIQMSQLI